MKRSLLLLIAALGVDAACSKADSPKTSVSPPPTAAPPATTPPPATPPVDPPSIAARTLRVRMLQQGTVFKFDPANFTVHPGDVVEFVNVSGFPHNVGFEPNQIPAGAAVVLNRAMAQRSSSLLGPMMQAANQTYRVSFVGAPVGAYHYFCLPHKALGMIGVITVAAAH